MPWAWGSLTPQCLCTGSPHPSGPLAWGALPILPFNRTSKETTKVELVSALVQNVNAVGDVVDGDVEDEGAVEDVQAP